MTIRIGTRGSPLALAQANIVQDKLSALAVESELVIIKTTGDKITDKPLYDIGGKALFLKELEIALMATEIDIAIHSLKDVPAEIPMALDISVMLEAEDDHDILISKIATSITDMPNGAIIGTCSMRRAAQIKAMRPDLKCQSLRGNISTRMQKLYDGKFDGIILAMAGLKRLNLLNDDCHILDYEQMIPAVGQGVIAIEHLKSNKQISALVKPLNHQPTWNLNRLTRGFLETINGSCRTPLGAHAKLDDKKIKARFMFANDDLSNLRIKNAIYDLNDDLYNQGSIMAKMLLAN